MSNVFEPQSAEDIENKIEKYRKSYAPEWTFDRENPDAGSVIAQIFARQIEENNRLMSLMPERYHLEFVNMLDATLGPQDLQEAWWSSTWTPRPFLEAEFPRAPS